MNTRAVEVAAVGPEARHHWDLLGRDRIVHRKGRRQLTHWLATLMVRGLPSGTSTPRFLAMHAGPGQTPMCLETRMRLV